MGSSLTTPGTTADAGKYVDDSPRGGEAIEEATTCNICYELFTEAGGERVPLQLPCGHCNCSSCVRYLDIVGKRCPLCKAQYTGSAATLPKNYTALHILGVGSRQAGVRLLGFEGNRKNLGGGFPVGKFFVTNAIGCCGYGIIRNCFRSNKEAADAVFFSLGALNILGPFLLCGSDITTSKSYCGLPTRVEEEATWGVLTCVCGSVQGFIPWGGFYFVRASTVLTLLLLKTGYERAELWARTTVYTWRQWFCGVFNPLSCSAFCLRSCSGGLARHLAVSGLKFAIKLLNRNGSL